jgi:carnitine 3-dehydrogenase
VADPSPPAAAGLLGGGVIGGGWAARLMQNGVDVRLYDPDPDAERKVSEMLENARRAWRQLTLVALPAEGSLTVVFSPEEAVEGVEFVQESAPERPEMKQELLARAGRAAGDDTIFASSTSGLRPSLLQRDMRLPQRLVVGHPFNPVYLLPLVEVCPGPETAPDTVERASAVYRSLGMAPLVMRTEIDGFIADRLQEALWREALWLVNDDVATVSEIDDAIRLGPGLRWSAMGSFLTYRIAGGEAGMRHFMAQFGPALKWPWTKLMDVPELTEALLDTIDAQSDQQAAGRSVRELEQLRDSYLVGVMQSLRATGIGAGEVLAGHERALVARVGGASRPAAPAIGGSPIVLRTTVHPEWVDYNGHAHESAYMRMFGDATDALLALVGIDAAYLTGVGSYFTVESHLCHLQQATAGQELEVATRVLGWDEKRLHVFHELRGAGEGEPVATAEQMLLHVSAATGRAGPAADPIAARVAEIGTAHAAIEPPPQAGRRISLRPAAAPPG